MALFRRNREFADLEARLREERPQARDDLVSRLGAQASPVVPKRSSGRVRSGIALGFTAAFAAAFAVLGGLALLPDANQQTSRLTISVPAKAVPVLRTLQADGVRLAATPVLLGQKAGSTAGASTIRGATGLKAIELNTESRVDTGKTATGKSSQPAAGTSRSLVPQVTSGASVIRLPAAVVYVPGLSTVLCLKIPIPPDIYYFTVIVPLASAPTLLSQYPGSFEGPCPNV